MGACASVPKSMRDQDADIPAPEPVKEEAVAAKQQTTKEENKADGEQQSLGSSLDMPESKETEEKEEKPAGQPEPEETGEKEEKVTRQSEAIETEEKEEKPAAVEVEKPTAVEVEIEKPPAVEVEKPAAVEVENPSQVVAAELKREEPEIIVVPPEVVAAAELKKEEPEIIVAPEVVAAAEPEEIVVSVEKKTEEQKEKN